MTKDNPNLPDDPDGMNDQRAQWADESIRLHAKNTMSLPAGEEFTPEELQEAVGDLLANIGHWLDRNPDTLHKRDFAQLLRGALRTYMEEIRPDPGDAENSPS